MLHPIIRRIAYARFNSPRIKVIRDTLVPSSLRGLTLGFFRMSVEIFDTMFQQCGREIRSLQPHDLVQRETRAAYAYWTKIKGNRPWPAREDLRLRDMASFAPYMSLVKVLEDGADFEHRIVGDAIVCAFSVPIQNRRFSEIAVDAPLLMEGSFALFRQVLSNGGPIAWQQRVLSNAININTTSAEMLLLPFGKTTQSIDHIAAFGVQGRCSQGNLAEHARPKP